MGNNNNKNQLLDDQFQFIQTIVDYNYGESRIYKKKESDELFAIISRAAGGSNQTDRRI